MFKNIDIIFKDIDKIQPDDNEDSALMPKPFVFQDTIATQTKVYLPGQIHTGFIDGLPMNNLPLYMCVHVCKQFANYPVLGCGIRCIPSNAKCPLGGLCHGARLMCNGKPIGKSVSLKYEYIASTQLKTR